MTEEEMLALCQNKEFVYKKYMGGPREVTIIMGGKGILVIGFKEDHNLSFPSQMGFLPETRKWRFDYDNQCILLTNLNGSKIVQKLTIPIIKDDKYIILKNLTDEKDYYISYLGINSGKQIQSKSILSKQRLLISSSKILDSDKKKLENYSCENRCEIQWLLYSRDELWNIIEATWKQIANDDHIKYVCLLLNGSLSLNNIVFSPNFRIWTSNEKSKLIAGPRSQVFLVLTQLLIKRNHLMLSSSDKIPSPYALMKDIVRE